MELRDTRLTKDEKKRSLLPARRNRGNASLRIRKGYSKPKKKVPRTTPPPLKPTTPRISPRWADIITIAQTPHVLVVDSQKVSSDESVPDEISDAEWSSVIVLGPPRHLFLAPPLSPSSQLVPPSTLRMSLRPCKSTIH